MKNHQKNYYEEEDPHEKFERLMSQKDKETKKKMDKRTRTTQKKINIR